MNKSKKLFVTVGTTSFDKLIETVTSESLLTLLQQHGFNKITLQIGRGKFEPDITKTGPLVEYFRFKPNIADEIRTADLIISHAGAGSILESLEAEKLLLVVVNEELMGNHQTELAEKLYQDGFLFYCNCKNLKTTIENSDFSSLKKYIPGDPTRFISFLNKEFFNS